MEIRCTDALTPKEAIAREIAEQVNGIVKGTIKTRPASCLLSEL